MNLASLTTFNAGNLGYTRLRLGPCSLWLGWGPPALLAYASRSGAGVFVGPVGVHVTISEARPRAGGW